MKPTNDFRGKLSSWTNTQTSPQTRTNTKKVEEQLRRVAQKGRAAGIHVIVATQRPSADVITSVVRSNLPAQLALHVRTAIDSRIIIDQAGAEALAGYGDALFRTPAGVLRVQCGIVVP